LVESEGDESPFADPKRRKIRMFNEFKEGLKDSMQKTLKDYQKNTHRTLEKTQK
jgi:hypothetical protein